MAKILFLCNKIIENITVSENEKLIKDEKKVLNKMRRKSYIR